jgi:hypothetical protein
MSTAGVEITAATFRRWIRSVGGFFPGLHEREETMRKTLTTTLVILMLATVGCDKRSDTEPTSQDMTIAAASSQSARHAPAGAEPGSHEDWCAEHQVPESQCTLCNPSLAAAFKATGDWCEEHGLPESHCRKCNPNLEIVRPPKTN